MRPGLRVGCYAALSLALAAVAPAQQSQFSFSYVLPSNLNVIPLVPGGTIVFPPTPPSTVAQAALTITNNGPASQIQGITASGSAFALQGLPLLPVTLNTAQTLQVLIRYQPSGAPTDTGQLQVTTTQGAVMFNLQGTISAPSFVYTVIQGTQSTPVLPGGTISFPDTNVGETSNLIVQIKNEGNLTGVVSSLALSGQDFQFTTPPAIPQTLAPGAAYSLSLTFAPAQPGDRVGNLFIGAAGFSLAGKGLGPKLAFSYVAGGTTVKLGSTDSVVFSPVMISQSGQLTFVIANQGTIAATIFNIGIEQAKSPFSVTGLPPLPLHLDPNAQATFQIVFTPIITGFSAGVLVVNNAAIGLIGSGTQPPPLPAYTFQGPSGNVQPLAQPAVSLKLSSPYPVAIAGVLTLSVASNLPADPAVQYSIGGRLAPFTIAANSTDAVFTGQGTEVHFQTGTVASTITLTPSFATEAGGVDLTPATPATLELTVPASAPVLLGIQISGEVANGFVLSVTGFSTTRSLAALNVTFTAAAGFSLPSTAVAVDLSGVAPAWFASNTSLSFGGLFLVQVPFTLHGKVPTGKTLLNAVASVSVTAASAQGTSNSVSVNLQ